MATTATNHVVIDEHGVARVAGTSTKVVEVIADYRIWGWTPEIIHREYPYLSLAQIHAAFSYYYDHQPEIDSEIDDRERDMERLEAAHSDSPIRKKLLEQRRQT